VRNELAFGHRITAASCNCQSSTTTMQQPVNPSNKFERVK